AVGADGVVGAGDEAAGRAVFIGRDDGDVVLDVDLAVAAAQALGVHGLGDAADPLPQVELMRGLVDQDAAAFAAPGGAPFALLIVAVRAPPGVDDPVGAADLAELAGSDDLLDLLVELVGALVEHDAERDVRVLG